jgi:hypothetical protein
MIANRRNENRLVFRSAMSRVGNNRADRDGLDL